VNNDVSNDHTAICFLLGNPDYGDAQGTTIARNRIHDCGKLPANGHEHGIYAENAFDTKIAGNWIYDNADWGIQLYPNAQRSEITGNVIDGNGMGLTFSGEGSEASSNNLLERNVLSNATRGYNVESWFGGVVGSANVARRNCLYGGRNSAAGGVQLTQIGFQALDNLVAAPEFVNREGKDFRLSAGSPCRSLLPEPDYVPGPGGSSQPVAPAAPAGSGPHVVLTAPRTVRRGRRVPLSGRVAPSRLRPGLRVNILVRRGGSWRRLAGTKIRANGKFRVKKSLRAGRRTRSLRLRASVRGVGASRAVRLTLR
jgi:parallel beta-helix repeat protein